MPHRDAIRREERPGRGAHQRGRGKGTDAKDSTGSAVRNRAVATTPPERKSGVPAPWRSLGEVLAEAADPLLRGATDAEVALFPAGNWEAA